jgi:hypothetical protein
MSSLGLASTFARFVGAGPAAESEATRRRVEQAFDAYERRVFAQTNQLFWWLLLAQWAFALLVATVWSPRAWAGEESTIHPHLLAAIFLGGLLVLPPLLLIRGLPYHWLTRHVVAVAQVAFSALLIHLTGGRIETHFHVFGSLAFLALYRDWRVLITATLIVAVDHLLRGIWYPVSVYGVPFATAWRTLEHAGWVVFEDVVLIWACSVSRREMWEICRRDEQNRLLLDELEQRVRERTAALESEVQHHQRTAADLRTSEERYRTLVDNAPIGIFKVTRAGDVRFANPYLLRAMGVAPDADLAQLNLADGRVLAREERERLWIRLEAEREVRGFETIYTRPDGTRLEVLINARLTSQPAAALAVCEGTVEDISAQKRAQRDLEHVHQQLVVASRQAGMADVATGVLHNVGNVLTSVNVTIHDVLERLRGSRISILHRVVEMLQRERDRLGTFFTDDPNGRRFPEFLAKLDTHLTEENTQLRADVESLVRHFAHIREVIVTQQSASRLFGVAENLPAAQLVEDALKLTADSLRRHEITLVRAVTEVATVKADRHKVLQILVNLLKNAKDAVLSARIENPCITVRVAPATSTHVAIVVEDNGVGIAPENLARIFAHGFTTKTDGHGFGLHSCVLAARDMSGDLAVASDGPGRGARFTLTLPVSSP